MKLAKSIIGINQAGLRQWLVTSSSIFAAGLGGHIKQETVTWVGKRRTRHRTARQTRQRIARTSTLTASTSPSPWLEEAGQRACPAMNQGSHDPNVNTQHYLNVILMSVSMGWGNTQ